MALDVKFLHGAIASGQTGHSGAFLVGHDDKVLRVDCGDSYLDILGAAGLKYEDNKIKLINQVSSTSANTISEIDLTLDSFLEKAKYFDKEVEFSAIATWAGEGFTAAAVEEAYKEAFAVPEGGELPAEHSAIVMVMHTEKTEDEHSLVVIPVGKLMGDVQTEVDKIEESVGLESDGTFVNEAEGVSKDAETIKDAIKAIDDNLGVKSTGTTISAETVWAAIEEAAAEKTVVVADEDNLNITVTSADTDPETGKITYTVGESGLTPETSGVVISAGTTVAANLGALDTKIGSFSASPEYASAFTAATENAIETGDTVAVGLNKLDNKITALVDEVLANEETDAAAIKALADAAGVLGEGDVISYEANTGATYISGATNLKDADDKLDAAIKELADKVSSNELTSTGDTISITKTEDKTNVDVKYDTKSIEQTTDGELKVKVDNSEVTETAGGIKLDDNNANGLTAKLYWGTF